jgi:A/G-specific adenine glycosylase
MRLGKHFTEKLLYWYNINKRDLPWRNTRNPYYIWLSEVILQQTRVEQGLPYFYRFIEKFPTLTDLALAEPDEVLRIWQGLGYYSRARNLIRCAYVLYHEFNGKFPQKQEELRKLKGIGDYTSAAIASFAFKEKVPVIDGNVYRVLTRFLGIDKNISSAEGKITIFNIANNSLPGKDSDTFNQAVMEFGALQCIPKNPRCETCVMNLECYSFKNKTQSVFPIKKQKIKKRERFFNYVVFKSNHLLYLKKRQEKDIWHGLYDFKLVESDHLMEEDQVLENTGFKCSTEDWILEYSSRNYRHVLTHQNIWARFYIVEIGSNILTQRELKEQELKKFNLTEVQELPKPILVDKFLRENFF